jgi:acyl carrier protein
MNRHDTNPPATADAQDMNGPPVTNSACDSSGRDTSRYDDLIRDAIERVAPDVDASTIPRGADFRAEAELDSMDFLALVTLISEATGIDVAEADYGSILTIAGFAGYLAARGATISGS